MSLGNKLRELREQRGWSRAEAARQLGLKYTTYVGYENDEREPGHNLLIDSARLYDVSLDQLLGLASFSESHSRYTTSDTITRQTLKDEERILLSHFGELDEEEQKFFLKQMERAAKERGETDDY